MTVVRRDLDTMVDAICDRIINANVGFTDKNPGSVLRTLVESIALEMDFQWHQLEYVDNAFDPDNASGYDLDRLVAIVNLVRNPATKVNATVRFGRSTPALSNVPIPQGTIVSTKADSNGHIIELVTVDQNKYISQGSYYVDVRVQAVVAGRIYIPPGGISIISNPIIGVEWVTNSNLINGGSDVESDASLRARSKLALSNIGKGTSKALIGAMLDIDGVVDASVYDCARGTGTADISVVCSSMPPTQELIDAINIAIADTKASGIDVKVIYPTTLVVDVSVNLTKDSRYDAGVIYDAVGNAISGYFYNLGIGDTLVHAKLVGQIALSHPGIIDIDIDSPTTNIIPTSTQIIRVGSIIIDGGDWVSG